MSILRSCLRYIGCHAQRTPLPGDRCIVFLYTNPDAKAGQFRLILIANRDEYFKRPAKQAHFWGESPAIIGGRDMEPGREGGSWFAISKKGRISTLLNVMGGTFVDMRSRGSIVPEYLTAETSARNHLSDLEARAHEFSLFNLLAVDVRRDGIDVHQLSNVGDTRKTLTRARAFLGVGNHLLGHPTRKVSAGLARFKDAVARWTDCHRHYPDPVLESLAPDASPERLQSISSVFISDTGTGYGTRAHTIVLIDNEDNVDYFEWAMTEPIQQDNPRWNKQHYTFQLDYGK